MKCTPSSCYRLQLHSEFTFDDAAAVAGYLKELGISYYLVDPDNRGPIDYEVRRSMLAELETGMTVEEILKRMDDGLPKLWVIFKALHLRRQHSAWFSCNSAYLPMVVTGPKTDHLIAYLRGENIAVIAPRWNVKLGGNFASTTLENPEGSWNHILTGDKFEGGPLPAKTFLKSFPVALLARDGE